LFKRAEITSHLPTLIILYIYGTLGAFLGSGAFCILKLVPFILIWVGFGFVL
jgi:hypothetical protein